MVSSCPCSSPCGVLATLCAPLKHQQAQIQVLGGAGLTTSGQRNSRRARTRILPLLLVHMLGFWEHRTRPSQGDERSPGAGQHLQPAGEWETRLRPPEDQDPGKGDSAQRRLRGLGFKFPSLPECCRCGNGSQRAGVRLEAPSAGVRVSPRLTPSRSLAPKTARAAERAVARGGRAALGDVPPGFPTRVAPSRLPSRGHSRPRGQGLRDQLPAQKPPPGSLLRPGLRAERHRGDPPRPGPQASAGGAGRGGRGRNPPGARATVEAAGRGLPAPLTPWRRSVLVSDSSPGSPCGTDVLVGSPEPSARAPVRAGPERAGKVLCDKRERMSGLSGGARRRRHVYPASSAERARDWPAGAT